MEYARQRRAAYALCLAAGKRQGKKGLAVLLSAEDMRTGMMIGIAPSGSNAHAGKYKGGFSRRGFKMVKVSVPASRPMQQEGKWEMQGGRTSIQGTNWASRATARA